MISSLLKLLTCCIFVRKFKMLWILKQIMNILSLDYCASVATVKKP